MPNELRPGTLYLVPTPLGNLDDITYRAVETLKGADVVACEDTRRSMILLNHLGIRKPLISYHAHSGGGRLHQILAALEDKKIVALVCDAGTPGISDPGAELVAAAIERGLGVCSLPGPCAAIVALTGSGLPTDPFFFIGFLPRRPARAKRRLQEAAVTGATVILYESPFRTRATVEWVRDVVGPETPVVIAREMTKIYEEFLRGSASAVAETLAGREVKGEVVILFRAAEETSTHPKDEE